MDVGFKQTGDITIVMLREEVLGTENTKEFKRVIAPVLEENTNMVIDLSQVQFMDSSGLGAILNCLRQLNARGGDLKLCNATKPVRALFQLVRMHRILEIHNTEEEAVQAFLFEAPQIEQG